ncbi:MAG TPA: RNA-binding cell elongation regulator Jag/EloR [Acidimicrobiia bacterium]|jgi:spoIIIJ-associated protein|nr:RNA-binding cell elongation regulator Jag/EloR [Acidimicrobiia bacterium]
MEWIVTTGKTVAEAVEAALDELGVDEADIEYEVLEESKRGFLSRLGGGSPARIKARVKPLSREKPDRRRRGGSRDRDRDRKSDSGERAARAPRAERGAADRPATERSGGGRPARGRPPAAGAGGDGPDEDVEEQPSTERSAAGERSATGSGSRNRRRKKKPQGATATAKAATPETTSSNGEEEEAVSGSEVSIEEQAEMAEVFTRGLIERFGLGGAVSARAEGDDDVTVDIQGTDLGLLIGPRAATVDAIQELVRTAVQRRIGGHGARIHVDVAGYRARRQEALAEFARQAAQRALESGRDQVFEPMSPVDRKIVHDIVNEIEGVATISEGEEPRRRVVIKALAGSS